MGVIAICCRLRGAQFKGVKGAVECDRFVSREDRVRDRDGASTTMRILNASNNLVVNVSSLAASKSFKPGHVMVRARLGGKCSTGDGSKSSSSN